MSLAIVAAMMPTEWMAISHTLLGMGEFPNAPVTIYLARSASCLYAIHGFIYLTLARDVPRYLPIIHLLGWLDVLFGFAVVAIGISAQLPAYWVAGEGPPVIVFGLVLVGLCRKQGRSDVDHVP